MKKLLAALFAMSFAAGVLAADVAPDAIEAGASKPAPAKHSSKKTQKKSSTKKKVPPAAKEAGETK
jgi:hypothetical protein